MSHQPGATLRAADERSQLWLRLARTRGLLCGEADLGELQEFHATGYSWLELELLDILQWKLWIQPGTLGIFLMDFSMTHSDSRCLMVTYPWCHLSAFRLDPNQCSWWKVVIRLTFPLKGITGSLVCHLWGGWIPMTRPRCFFGVAKNERARNTPALHKIGIACKALNYLF